MDLKPLMLKLLRVLLETLKVSDKQAVAILKQSLIQTQVQGDCTKCENSEGCTFDTPPHFFSFALKITFSLWAYNQ